MLLRRLLLRASPFLLAAPVLAGVNQWTLLGPHGHGEPLPVQALAVSAEAIYAGSGADVFRSIDGGLHWTLVFHAGTSPVWSLASSPDSPSIVYAGTADGVFRSVDGGDAWFVAGLRGETVFSLAVDPGDSSRVYAGTSAPLGATGVGRIFKSEDAGRTWTRQHAFTGYATALAIDPNDPNIVLAGGTGGILRTQDGGSRWTLVAGATGEACTSLAFDPADSSYAYATWTPTICPGSCPPGRLGHSDDGGATWSDVTTLPGTLVGAAVVDPAGTVYANAHDRIYASHDHAATWASIETQTPLIATVLALDPLEPAKLYAATSAGVYGIQRDAAGPCVFPGAMLCLHGGRFQVTVGWQASPLGPTFPAPAVPVTTKSGYFWFFDPDNVEVMVKILDGTSINGHFWVFFGALSNVQYTVHITDTLTGETKDYVNPQGTLAGVADTQAFPAAPGNGPTAGLGPKVAGTIAGPGPLDPCQPDDATLCLNEGRFRVVAAFQLTPSGPAFEAQAVPLTGDTGYFWFFEDANVELVLKVLDGRPVNGHFWVFYGALSNVEYTITVTDTQTGEVRTYHNARGDLASVADTTAFR